MATGTNGPEGTEGTARTDLLDVIRTRRSIRRFKAEPPPRELVEEILEAATWAPNHLRNEPWFFHVVTGPALERLGDLRERELIREAAAAGRPAPSPKRLEMERERTRSAPYVIFVTAAPGRKEEEDRENVYATFCAVQNLLLGAHARGLGAILRTGILIRERVVREFLGLDEGEHLVAAIYLGYPDEAPEMTRRPVSERMRWIAE